uniref:Uncharacterized protein n=1 Tax=Varanus komodoensis TaxID=61221 RepID=A0A8D2JCZ3_VARKO
MAGTGLGSAGLDLEKLRMAGAGLALAVLTSGGDAQGQSEEGGARAGGTRAPSARPGTPHVWFPPHAPGGTRAKLKSGP